MSEKEVIAVAVAERRKALSLSQAALANLAGISRGTVRNIETANVAPNESTWERLEPVLGWAPGSLTQLVRGESPSEALPASVLSFVLEVLADGVEGDYPDRDAIHLLERFKMVIGGATAEGVLGDEARIELTDIIDALAPVAEDDAIEAAQQTLATWFRTAEQQRVSNSIREIEQLQPGDHIIHTTFGLGRVLSVTGEGAKRKADISFTSADHPKTLLLRYTPYKRVAAPIHDQAATEAKGRKPVVNGSRAEQNLEHLGQEAAELIAEGQVIDCNVVEPNRTDNIAVVTMVIRKSAGPLSAQDRLYTANLLKALSSPDMTLRLTNGDIIKVNIKKADNGGALFSQPTSVTAAEDPWASVASKKSSSDFSDEPPF
ncbi:helix-turn-helix domain-containing protein [Nonomuraea sp. NPDC049607]|uniref:helix-turn-helix transcriptional regulator n=1 Tax=Nonomuraea sp. NPDC049607 TaxID=3154732 RepID=UPI003446E983